MFNLLILGDEKGATIDDHHITIDIPIDTIVKTSTAPSKFLTQMSQDTSDDGGDNDVEKRCQLQLPDNTLATATHNRYLTSYIGTRNKTFSKTNHIHVVTPTDSNILSNTIQPADIPNKGVTSNDHKACIDVDTVDEMAQKRSRSYRN